MGINIKAALKRRPTRPATWRDVVTESLWMALAIVCAFRFVPVIVAETAMSARTGLFVSVAFVLIAAMHALDAIRITRGLRKQKTAA